MKFPKVSNIDHHVGGPLGQDQSITAATVSIGD
jgi:hypothetical protein